MSKCVLPTPHFAMLLCTPRFFKLESVTAAGELNSRVCSLRHAVHVPVYTRQTFSLLQLAISWTLAQCTGFIVCCLCKHPSLLCLAGTSPVWSTHTHCCFPSMSLTDVSLLALISCSLACVVMLAWFS